MTRDTPAAGYHVPIPGFTSFTTAQGAGKLVFVSGLTSRGADGEIQALGDVAGQAGQILTTMRALMADAGGTLRDIVQIRTYITDIETWPQVEEVWRRYWPERFPASTLVQVSRLFDVRQLIETDAIAFLPESVD
ncbi:MAG TPA: RidA family protein [Streptosporangiaceae bacterium]|nr:RidA family protein [Streptosporangiaceae bacterium]